MLPLKKELQPLHPCGTTEAKARPRSAAAANLKVLSVKTQCVAPVGAWVESGLDCMEEEENCPFAAAAEIEELYKERKREKERLLKRFQEEVKHRVNQHVKIKRKQHLQESYEAVLKESSVIMGFSDSAPQWTPKKSTCLYRITPDPAIGSSSNKVISVLHPNSIADSEEKVLGVQFAEQAKAVQETVQQVRHRLASRKTGSKGGTPQKPLVVVIQNKQEPTIGETDPVNANEANRGAILLVGYHDLPAELQKQRKEQWNKNPRPTTKSQKLNKKIRKGASLVDPSVSTASHISQIHWSGTEAEDSKKQRQIQYLRYKRLFMDIEREQVKEQQRQKECQRRVERIKREKEFRRFAEEQKMQEKSHSEQIKVMDKDAAEEKEKIKDESSQGKTKTRRKLSEKLEPLDDSKEKKRALEKQLRDKEYSRYVEALRAQMREKIQMYNIDLPALCFCGPNFWDSHPDSCANNCVFYKNHKAYSQALQSVISSCDIFNGGSNTRLDIHTFATVHSRHKHS